MVLGELIAKARKDIALSVDDLAESTSLRVQLIREIEKDDFSHCGGEIYARGHVRNIAKVLKADEREFLRLFDEEQASAKRTMQNMQVKNTVMRQSEGGRKISIKALIVIAVASLGIVGVAQNIISNTSSVDVAIPASSPSPTQSLSPQPTESESAQPTAQSSFSTGIGVEVRIDATRAKSWLFVSDAAGRTLFSGQIPKGQFRIFTTDTRLDLKVGNAGGVDLEINGENSPSIGGDGEVVSVSYGTDS